MGLASIHPLAAAEFHIVTAAERTEIPAGQFRHKPRVLEVLFPFPPSCSAREARTGLAELLLGDSGLFLAQGRNDAVTTRTGNKGAKKGAGDDFTGILPHRFIFMLQKYLFAFLAYRSERIESIAKRIKSN